MIDAHLSQSPTSNRQHAGSTQRPPGPSPGHQPPIGPVLDYILAALDEIKDCLAGRTKSHLTVAELARQVGRSEYTVRRWITEGRITATRVAGTGPKGRLLIAREQLNKLVMAGSGTNLSAGPSAEL